MAVFLITFNAELCKLWICAFCRNDYGIFGSSISVKIFNSAKILLYFKLYFKLLWYSVDKMIDLTSFFFGVTENNHIAGYFERE